MIKFKRDFTDKENLMLGEALNYIVKRLNYLLKYPEYAYLHFNAVTDAQKNKVIECLHKMTFVSCGIYKCATKWHPISWFGYGLCCPFKPGKGILISEKTFKEGVNSLIEIIIHEFSHSSLGTIDGLYAKGIDSDKFEDRIKDAWVWTFII